MNLEYFIAKKVATSSKKTESSASFSRWIIRVAIAATAIGVAVMIIATALISGFKKEISSKIFGFLGHIQITDATVAGGSLLETSPLSVEQVYYPNLDTIGRVDYQTPFSFMGQVWENRMMDKTTKGGVRHIQTFAIKPGIIKTDTDIEGIAMKGVGQDFDWGFMKNYLIEGDTLSLPKEGMSREVLISQKTAKRLNLKVGDKMDVYFITNNEELRRRLTIKGIYNTGLDEYDKRLALIDIRQTQRLLGWDETQVGGFEVFLDEIDDLEVLTDYIYLEKIPNGQYAQSIRSKKPEIFHWLDLQDINEVVILSLMTLVGIINMITALLILILDRTQMIGVLKALGSSDWSIRKLFLYYASYIILWALLWGNVIGIGLCWLQDKFKFIKLQEQDYYLSYAPIHFDMATIILLNVVTLIITLIFLIIPSYLITRISPVKAIRFE